MTSSAASAPVIELEVTGIAHGGVGVARHDGRVVFVSDAIPGERVHARVSDDSKVSFWRAETVEVLDASAHRVAHIWPEADVAVAPEQRPGGAEFGHIALAHQRALKQTVLRESLQRMGKVETNPTIVAAGGEGEESADGTGWRTRLSLHVDEAGRVGPYAARSHSVIEVGSHPLAVSGIESVALTLDGLEPGRVDLVQASDGMVRVLSRPEPAGRGGPAGQSRAKDAARGDRRRRGRGAAARSERPAPRPVDPQLFSTIIERVGDREFSLDAGGFWQVHRLAPATLTRAVTDAVATLDFDPEAANLDLYGGVGLLAAALGDIGGSGTRVTSVEADARATEHAGENLAEWIGARAETSRVDRYLARLLADASPLERARLRRGTVVLDPPRSGAGAEVVRSLARLQPDGIVYVACDPVALARDVATFGEAGYRLRQVTAYDLFPHSHHVEAVAVLSR
ncbi:class I SAM-dependent RNA methyltransferase [Microbacterium keratanolyticum]|uniref:class I SAM-dependent RNA methyltransferase n=1 Tax=Microbacterium keratanolyticum TaxID=67574 RepID=UPI0036394B6E